LILCSTAQPSASFCISFIDRFLRRHVPSCRWRIIGLQVRALPSANQVPEPIGWRLNAQKTGRQNRLLANR
jgi:hypothetical protein